MAVIASTLIIVVGFSLQNLIRSSQSDDQPDSTTDESVDAPGGGGESQRAGDTGGASAAATGLVEIEMPPAQCQPHFENQTIRARFGRNGATLRSLQLLAHTDVDGVPVEMIFSGESGLEPLLITIGRENTIPLNGEYNCRTRADGIEFYKSYALPAVQREPFTVRKIFRFSPGEYLFEVEVRFENSTNLQLPLEAGESAYRLYFGPQIGPQFEKLDNRREYRNYYYFDNNRRRRVRFRGADQRQTIAQEVEWVAIEGKYFALIAVPHSGVSSIALSREAYQGLPASSQLYIERFPIKSSVESDSYLFYLGPKIPRELAKYDRAEDNKWGLKVLNLKKVLPARPLIGWLETILKWGLQGLYRFVPNYGIAIILLTIAVKLLLTPLTSRSQRSTMRMQELNPRVTEIRTQHKSDPQKMNAELAALYRREKVNPAGGCLPLLLQFPFFIAMFGIFNNHFELRGAQFISGWIDDLSQPESIFNFGSFIIPVLGWNDLRLLPILFVGTQILSGIIMRNPAQSQQQARMLAIMMPVVFFFLLYNMPSGLLLYWIVTNILTAAQQGSAVMAKKRRDAARAHP